VAFEHPLSAACAGDDMPRPSTVIAAMVKVCAMVLRFMRNLLFRFDRSGFAGFNPAHHE
jgi:hypothetical protein